MRWTIQLVFGLLMALDGHALAADVSLDAYEVFSKNECKLLRTARSTQAFYEQALAVMSDYYEKHKDSANLNIQIKAAIEKNITPAREVISSIVGGKDLSAFPEYFDELRGGARLKSISKDLHLEQNLGEIVGSISSNTEELIALMTERMELGEIINNNEGIVEVGKPFVVDCDRLEFGFSGTWHPRNLPYCGAAIHLDSTESQSWVTGGDSNFGDCKEMETENVPRNTPQNSRHFEQKNHLLCVRADKPDAGYIEQNDHFEFTMKENNRGILHDIARNTKTEYVRCPVQVVRNEFGKYTYVSESNQNRPVPTRYDLLLAGDPIPTSKSISVDVERPNIFKKNVDVSPQLSLSASGYCAKLMQDTREMREFTQRVPVAYSICTGYGMLAIKLAAKEFPELEEIVRGYQSQLADEPNDGFLPSSRDSHSFREFVIRYTDTGAPVVKVDRPGSAIMDRSFIRRVTEGTVLQYFGTLRDFRDYIVGTVNSFVSGKQYVLSNKNMASLPGVERNGDQYIELAMFDEYINRPEWVLSEFDEAVRGQIDFALEHEFGHSRLGHTKLHPNTCNERKTMEWAADEAAIREMAASQPIQFGYEYERFGFERFLRNYGSYGFDVASQEAICQYGEPGERLKNALRIYSEMRSGR